MDVSQEFKDKAIELLEEKFWIKIMEPFKGINRKFISDITKQKIMTEAFSMFEKDMADKSQLDNQFIIYYEDRIRQTKKRWFNAQLKDKSNLYEETWVLGQKLYALPEGPWRFKAAFQVDSPEALYKKIKGELEEWKNNKNKYLCEFRYIGSKPAIQIKRAAINDILALLLIAFMDYPSINKTHSISQMPEIMVNGNLIVTAGKSVLDFSKDVNVVTVMDEKTGMEYLQVQYLIDNDKVFQSRYSIEAVKMAALENFNLYALRAEDIVLFDTLMSFANKDFFTSNEIEVQTSKLLREMNLSTSEFNYKKIYDSLRRMKLISISVKDKNSETSFYFNILSNLEIITPSQTKHKSSELHALNTQQPPSNDDFYKEDNDSFIEVFDDIDKMEIRESVKVTINKEIVNQIIGKRTINMYREKLNALKRDASKILLLRLERERITLYYKGDRSNSMKKDISFFRSIFLFTGKQTNRHYKLIENALDEIKENEVTLKDYSRSKDYFYLEFYPVTDRERLDLSIEAKQN